IQLNPRKNFPSAQFTGRMRNHPSAPPAIAPGRKRTRYLPQVNMVAFKPIAAASPPVSPTGRPSQAPNVGASNDAVASPPNRAKLHHGRASLVSLTFCPGVRPAKMEAARAGVIVMALRAEMIIDAEIVRANWRKKW